MDTIKLFYEDAYIREFDAELLSCQPEGDHFKAVLDRTAFFPEGGGQYGDIGYLGEARVLDTQERDGLIYHKVDREVPAGTVHGCLDWNVRFDRMQQHSGEHILSGLVHRRFGYNNVGFHLNDDYCVVDFDGPITRDEMREMENEINLSVFQNQRINILYPDDEKLKKLDYRSKKEINGRVRLVEIEGTDLCACCAPHVRQTGEIGLVKIVGQESHRGGVRLVMLAGSRALKAYQHKQDQAKEIGAMLCANEDLLTDAVRRMHEENQKLKYDLLGMEKKLMISIAERVNIDSNISLVFSPDLGKDQIRELVNLVLSRGARICGAFSGDDRDGYRYVIGSKAQDVRKINEMLKEKFSARGGGKPEMVQGSLSGTESEIKALLL